MDFAALFKIFQAWGPSALSSVLIVVVLYLVKKVDTNGKEDRERAKGFQILLDSKLKELREDTARVSDEHGRRLSCIEMEYVRRETFYRELGGWKDDINRLSSQISTQFTEFMKSIVELWKDRKD